VAAPTEKDVETMPTQKVFKQRVRARMTKTGESYAAARRQLLRKTIEPEGAPIETGPAPADQAIPAASIPADALLVADEAMLRATGKDHAEWFAILDAWGATDHNHTEIARWLSETQGTPGWWTQNITVAYERARGMRARHQMRDGFSISATKTIAAGPERALLAFTSESLRRGWLPDAPMRQRPTRAALSARFDWADPPSRIVVSAVPKGESRSVVAVAHEQLPDADAGDQFKRAWREWLSRLKTMLEGG
jgi:hypothetical protein